MRILGLFNTTYDGGEHGAHTQMVQKVLRSIEIAEHRKKEGVDIKILTTTCSPIPGNPFQETISTHPVCGIPTYILQLIDQLNSVPAYDVVTILEHDVMIPHDYFNQIAYHWQLGYPLMNNLNHEGISKKGYHKYTGVVRPYCQMTMRYGFYRQHIENKLALCESLAAPGETYGQCSIEPTGMPFLNVSFETPSLHISGEGLGKYRHNYTNHNVVNFAAEPYATDLPYWGKHLELLPYLGEVK